jgi:RNA 3'-terminal phosphate cyclase (ATP)
MREIDGSFGEGGGQILRTALSLSCLFGRPFRIFNLRKGRKKPGLMPQHLTAVRASQRISGAEVHGDAPGSTEVSFFPGSVTAGQFFLDTGTAGSVMLVLQTLIPSLIFLKEKSSLLLTGGTHVSLSPSFHYVAGVFAPMLRRLGVAIRLTIDSYGFYPKGGGAVRADILPAREIRPLECGSRGGITALRGYSAVANLPLSIAERQRDAALKRIASRREGSYRPGDMKILEVPSPGQGTFLHLDVESENSLAGFTALGERGKRAETVGEEAVDRFLAYHATGAALDPYLADQIVLYLSLCRERSEFTTSRITPHLMTNLWVIGLFHEFTYSVEGEVGEPGRVRIN